MMLPNNTTVCDQINHYTDDEDYYDENYYNDTDLSGDEIYSTLDLVIQNHIWKTNEIMLIFIAIFIVLGNTLLLVATWKEKSLHHPNKYFIASRAVADLLVGIFVAPLWLFRFYGTEPGQHQALPSFHLCDFFIWIDGFALTASIYTLTFICYERCIKIGKPHCKRSQMTNFRSMKIIFIIWLISTVFASYAATPYSGSIGILFVADACLFEVAKKFYTFQVVSVLILPISVMVIILARSLIVAQIVKRKNVRQKGTDTEQIRICHRPRQEAIFLRDLKAIRTLFVDVGVFIFCWVPYLIWILLSFYFSKVFDGDENSTGYWYSRVVVFTLPLIKSLCNPIIYGCLDKKYKKAFKHLFQQAMCRKIISRKRKPLNSITSSGNNDFSNIDG